MSCPNPFAFRPGPVVFWTTITYLALLIAVVVINDVVPPPELTEKLHPDVNLTQAWLDLATLTEAYHPYNSRKNDEIRDWLLRRIQKTLDENGADWTTDSSTSKPSSHVTVFNDVVSNVTMLYADAPVGSTNTSGASATYFEGNNILVYIRGSQDEEGEWWKTTNARNPRLIGQGGTLINAHFDSVSTGFGATDDGMGVVTVLQIINHFTKKDRQPQRGILALLNNGEEDGLLGAKAFGNHPTMAFVHTFLNLEGAGAGGRSILFRSTDEEVTRAYGMCENPFGTVIGTDGFKRGFIRSQTDFVVLDGVYGQRGLDLSFYKPRARYHTNQDDARHTSRASLWHMLSAADSTVAYLSSDTGDTFVGTRPDGARDKAPNGRGNDGVWFDILGKGFVLFGLRGMFAWSLTVLIASPLILIVVSYLLVQTDKYYLFSASVRTYENPDYEPVSVGGWKGFFRFPFALGVAGALTLGSAFLLRKINPFIIYGSPYVVWAMMGSLFYFTFWLIVRGASYARPSALSRGYVHIWLFIIGWSILVVVTVFEDRFRIAAGYLFVFFQSAVFLATLITLLELFALPKKTLWGQEVREDHEAQDRLQTVPHSDALITPSPGEIEPQTHDGNGDDEDEEAEPASETTPLVGRRTRKSIQTTFATTYRRSMSALVESAKKRAKARGEPFDDEQGWSAKLPTWTWLLQFLILGPFTIILFGQTGLLLSDSLGQTGVDGSSLLLPYLAIAVFTILALLPITPFIHRIQHHLPVFLLVVFIATLIYNLAAFPFSADSRYKAYFRQHVDVDTGKSTVELSGIEQYLRPIIAELPSAAGQTIGCGAPSARAGLVTCSWDGAAVRPRLDRYLPIEIPPVKHYAGLITVNVTRTGTNQAHLAFDAIETKSCFLHFTRPVSRFVVKGGMPWDDRFGAFPDAGLSLIKAWRRDWNTPWVFEIEWENEDGDGAAHGGPGAKNETTTAPGLEGHVACQWADANKPGTITALDEALKYAPTWAAITKQSEGLVEARRSFMV